MVITSLVCYIDNMDGNMSAVMLLLRLYVMLKHITTIVSDIITRIKVPCYSASYAYFFVVNLTYVTVPHPPPDSMNIVSRMN